MRCVRVAIGIWLSLLLGSQSVLADSSPASTDATKLGPDLETWLDGFMASALHRNGIAGAVVAVVADGATVLQKGYGYADMAAKIPVDARTTLFRPGSASKLFTWTAVMQLVESGKLDLDRDVSEYLDFDLTKHSGPAITLRHLMTHRAGFEETLKNFYTFDPKQGLALARYVREHTPERIYPAGNVPAYSNYGTALAGYLVERVSGEPFEEYVERHIFAPLKMSRSTFRQPAPPEWSASKGYGSADGAPVPFEIFNPSPAGAMSATAADMARFMVAHLEVDDPSRNPLLSPVTMRLMHEHAAGDRRLNGMALGFRESSRNGRRIIGHGGDTFAFHTDLLLLPAERVGLFVSFNSRGTNDAVYAMRRALVGDFIDRYFPTAEESQTPVVRAANGILVEGLFESSRRWETSFLSLLNMLGQDAVTAQPDGTIEISSVRQINGRPKRWREATSADWQEIDGEDRLLGDVHDSRVVSLMRSEDPATVLLRAPSWRASSWGLPLLLVAVVVVGATVFAPLVAAAVRGHLGVASILSGHDLHVARAVWIFAVTAIVLVGGWASVFAPLMEQRVDFFNESLDPWLRALQVFGALQLIAVPIGARSVWLAWTLRHSWLCKLRRLAILAAFTVLAWYLIVFGFITTGVRY